MEDKLHKIYNKILLEDDNDYDDEELTEQELTEKNFFGKLVGWGLSTAAIMQLIIPSVLVGVTGGLAIPFLIPAFIGAGILGGMGGYVLKSIKSQDLRDLASEFIGFIETKPALKAEMKKIGSINLMNPTDSDVVKLKEMAQIFKKHMKPDEIKRFKKLIGK